MGLNAWMYGLIGAGTVVAAASVILFVLQLIFLLRKKICTPILPCAWTKALDSVSCKDLSKTCVRSYTFQEVEKFCEGFINLVGETPCHCVYKGILPDGTEVAVKRTKDVAGNGSDVETNFHFQMNLLSRVHHQHVVNLVGFCDEKSDRMLVYQYAPNGNLFDSLHNDDEHLSWKQRMRIAVGIACGMAFLHHSCGSPIAHGNLTSQNVLLTEDYCAKISGIGTHSLYLKSRVPKSKAGCSDPKLQIKGICSPFEDVYAFGEILLELVSGKLVYSKESGTIVEWADQFLQSRDQMTNLTDSALKGVVLLELYSLCDIARLCVQHEASSRPSMEDVLYMLVQSLGIRPETVAPSMNPPP